MLFIHLFSGIVAYSIDYRYSFTASKNVIDYLKEKQLSDKNIVTLTCDGTMLSSYLQRKIYFLTDKSEQSYCHWEANTIGVLYTKEMITTMLSDYIHQKQEAIFISGSPFLNIPKNHSWQNLNSQIKIRQLISFDENIQENANFSIYEVVKINPEIK
jgi:hypothetical protein